MDQAEKRQARRPVLLGFLGFVRFRGNERNGGNSGLLGFGAVFRGTHDQQLVERSSGTWRGSGFVAAENSAPSGWSGGRREDAFLRNHIYLVT